MGMVRSLAACGRSSHRHKREPVMVAGPATRCLHCAPSPPSDEAMSIARTTPPLVRHFRQALLWPLRLMPVAARRRRRPPAAAVAAAARPRRGLALARGRRRIHRRPRAASTSGTTTSSSPSCRTCSASSTARAARGASRATPSRARRCASSAASDVAARARACRAPGDAPITLDIVHVDLYFFFDVDVVMLNVEVARRRPAAARRCRSCSTASAAPIPAGWDAQRPARCTAWPASNGSAPTARCWRHPTRSSASAFLAHVAEHRAPRIAGALGLPAAAAGQRPFRASRARCATGRSSTTACR